MRDQYVGDISDLLKFAFLRAVVGDDRKLGIAWYYVPGDDGRADGRHVEWRDEPPWATLDAALHSALSALPERSIEALERASIWPLGVQFYRDPIPPRNQRSAWVANMRASLAGANVVFLDPDNGLGKETRKHATLSELAGLRKPGRAVILISFPGRHMPHDELIRRLHKRVSERTNAERVLTLRTNISVPRAPGLRSRVQRQRWFTVLDPDDVVIDRIRTFAQTLAEVPSVTTRVDEQF